MHTKSDAQARTANSDNKAPRPSRKFLSPSPSFPLPPAFSRFPPHSLTWLDRLALARSFICFFLKRNPTGCGAKNCSAIFV